MFANVLKTDGRKFCLHSGRVSQRVMQVQVPAVSEENTLIVCESLEDSGMGRDSPCSQLMPV